MYKKAKGFQYGYCKAKIKTLVEQLFDYKHKIGDAGQRLTFLSKNSKVTFSFP
jgi:hypothetical protein